MLSWSVHPVIALVKPGYITQVEIIGERRDKPLIAAKARTLCGTILLDSIKSFSYDLVIAAVKDHAYKAEC